MEQAIMDIMGVTMDNLRRMATSERIIGSPVKIDAETTVIPYCKISLGFLYGGGEYSETAPKTNLKFPFASAGGGGITIKPCGFLVARNGEYTVHSDEKDGEDNKWVSLAKAALNAIKKP